MQSPSSVTNPNLTMLSTFSYKDVLVKKLAHAVACSITSQLIILIVYVIFANINIFHPSEWLGAIVQTFCHLSTWIFVIIFSFIIFAQCLICAKDYVLMTTYCSTRFRQFLHIFSLHNFLLFSLHIVMGGAFVWQILSVIDSSLRHLTTECEFDSVCLVEDTFFLITSGFWMGFYYFVRIHISAKHIVFPVIQQKKFLQFRTNISILFRESMVSSLLPTFYFFVFYSIWGYQLETRFISVFGLDRTFSESGVLIHVYCWWFGSLYFFSMNLMRFFFHLFLTEPVQFPLVKENEYVLTLQEALLMSNLPIIQNLACLDLFLLSQWSPIRRQILFSLSQPGGHPHNWNALVESILKLFNEYTELLKRSMESTQSHSKVTTHHEILSPFAPPQSPICPGIKFRGLRNMRAYSSDQMDIVDVTHSVSYGKVTLPSLKGQIRENVTRTVGFLKVFCGINFLFGELPQVNIQRCLGNGQLIVWASQGIAELTAASLSEDKYGIVQKDLPVIINTLVQLKQSLDKLNKVPVLTRKVATLDDFNYKMKNAVTAAVKHSLFNICLNFGDYFNDFPLSKDVLQYLQVNIMLKSAN